MHLRQPIWIGYFNQSVFTLFPPAFGTYMHMIDPDATLSNKFVLLLLLDRFRLRTRTSKTTWKWGQNGVAYPYMGTTRHFHVVFADVRVLDLNLSMREFTIYDAAGSTTRSKFQLKNEG
jgi:hypothetical protein